jgi:hypothetical protein
LMLAVLGRLSKRARNSWGSRFFKMGRRHRRAVFGPAAG